MVFAASTGCTGQGDQPTPTTEPSFTLPSSPVPDVAVPDLAGLTTAQADMLLRDVELYLVVNQTVDGTDDKRVVEQRPAAGTAVPPGSVVLVTARCLPAPCPSPPIDQFIYDPCTCAYR